MPHTISKESLDRLADCKPTGLFSFDDISMFTYLATNKFNISDKVIKTGLIGELSDIKSS